MFPHLSLNSLAQDIRYAARAVRKDLGLFLFAIAIVGLGVGACTAIFSVLNPLMLRSLPFEEPERLAWIAKSREGGMSAITSRTSNLRDFRELNQTFESMTGYFAFFEHQTYNLVGNDSPERLVGVAVAQNFLDVLGVQPAVGRNFNVEEGQFGGPRAVIFSHAFWSRHYAGDSSIVGTTIGLNNEAYEVIGVLPASFDFASIFAPHTRVDFLEIMPISDETDRWGNTLSMIGRLAPGATVAQAQADLERIVAGLQEEQPDRWGLEAAVSGLQEQIAGPFRSALLLLAMAAFAVMLIVCVNLSNLLLAKASRRSREMALRSALGASRTRLIRQMLFESLLLSLGGTLVGIVIAFSVTRFVSGLSGLRVPLLQTVSIDAQALLFSAGLAAFVGVLVGIVPALQLSSGSNAEALRSGGRSMSASRKSTRFREVLVMTEVALACVLLVLGGLLLRSFQNVMDVDLGFQPEEVVAWNLSAGRSFENLEEQVGYFRQITESVEAIPGVLSAGLIDAIPMGKNRTWAFGAPGQTYNDEKGFFIAYPHLVDSGYFETLDIPLLAGRSIAPEDDESRGAVVVLNETAARIVYHGEDSLGRQLLIGETEAEIIGIVRDIRHRSLEISPEPQVYIPISQMDAYSNLDLVVRSSVEASILAGSVSAAIHALDPKVPTREYTTLSGIIDRSASPRKLTVQLLVAFAAAALLLAALGIYGVLSYSVAERIPEIGIRMALGETAAGILRRVVGQTMTLAAIGLGIGALGSILTSRWITSLLFNVEPADPWTFSLMALLLLSVAGLAGFIPALRASRTDVASVLRSD